MLLKHVYLYLNLDEYPDALVTPFGFRTRYVCNYLERRLRSLRFHAEGFSKICVQGRHAPEESCPIVPENAVVPAVRFDELRYKALGPDEHHEFFIDMLCQGLEKCARHHSVPLAQMLEAIDEFRRGGYKNEWTQQKKLLRPLALRSSLHCSLDTQRFILTLKLERKDQTVFEQRILETEPDEIIFGYQFKEVALEGNNVVVKNRFGKPTFSLDLSSLS